MTLSSIDPTTGEERARFPAWTASDIESALTEVAQATPAWAGTAVDNRLGLLRRTAALLRDRKSALADIITSEMGKLIGEAEAEIEKCAWVCEYYADNAKDFLSDHEIESDASKSLVAYQPLGTLLAIMPWNFPFWQFFRCAVPALAAGNTVVLKHASNVPRCALTLEEIFRGAGFPEGVMRTLLVTADQVADIIGDPRIHAVSLTGSTAAGRKVAEIAGRHLKKTVLELGGSDPFVVLDDANIPAAAATANQSRFLNCGQSCIAAKRFIVVDSVAEEFLERFQRHIENLRAGDPRESSTTLAPMAREDLRTSLNKQVEESVAAGAEVRTGGESLDRSGWFYAPTLLDQVTPGMPAYEEELFGPVAAVIRAGDEADALRIANDSRFGLGGSIWSRDPVRGDVFARQLACGCAFVNELVKSDPRVPFGGIKDSGYGRELSLLGIREFVNAKTIWFK